MVILPRRFSRFAPSTPPLQVFEGERLCLGERLIPHSLFLIQNSLFRLFPKKIEICPAVVFKMSRGSFLSFAGKRKIFCGKVKKVSPSISENTAGYFQKSPEEIAVCFINGEGFRSNYLEVKKKVSTFVL